MPSAVPTRTAPSLHHQEYAHKDLTTSGIMSRFQLPTRAHPCHADAPSAVIHACARLPSFPAAASKSGPWQAKEGTSQQHRPDCICIRYAAFHTIVIKDEQQHSKNAVNKRISKGRKTHPNSNVLFEVRIFKLRLTSLVSCQQFHKNGLEHCYFRRRIII